ncbi:MAG: hypothetical protein IKZ43_09555 [Acidaminococcaceae bacterium]|nr:hypothetical protein [Acidaminococcaceae bacterium]
MGIVANSIKKSQNKILEIMKPGVNAPNPTIDVNGTKDMRNNSKRISLDALLSIFS